MPPRPDPVIVNFTRSPDGLTGSVDLLAPLNSQDYLCYIYGLAFDGIDWQFSFTTAPAYYYGFGSFDPIPIALDFGPPLNWSSFPVVIYLFEVLLGIESNGLGPLPALPSPPSFPSIVPRRAPEIIRRY